MQIVHLSHPAVNPSAACKMYSWVDFVPSSLRARWALESSWCYLRCLQGVFLTHWCPHRCRQYVCIFETSWCHSSNIPDGFVHHLGVILATSKMYYWVFFGEILAACEVCLWVILVSSYSDAKCGCESSWRHLSIMQYVLLSPPGDILAACGMYVWVILGFTLGSSGLRFWGILGSLWALSSFHFWGILGSPRIRWVSIFESSWGHLGLLELSYLSHLGITVGSSRIHFWVNLGSPFSHRDFMLESYWDHLGFLALSFLSHLGFTFGGRRAFIVEPSQGHLGFSSFHS